MSEIDVTKCGAYDEGKCYAEEYEMTHAYCEDNKNCHYKQFEKLKIENKNLKKVVEFQRDRYYLSTRGEEVKRLEEKLEKIKEAIFNYQKTINNHYIVGLNAQILKIIESEE